MEDTKLTQLREEVIKGIENTLSELYKKLLPLPEDFEEIAGTMDDDDIIGSPEGPDLLDYYPETYRWLADGESKDGRDELSVFWFDNPYTPKDQASEISEHGLKYAIEVNHEFGELVIYKEKGEVRVISKLLPETEDPINSENNRLEMVAGINLLQTIYNRLIELLSKAQ